MSARTLGFRSQEGVSRIEVITEAFREWADRFEGRPNRARTREALVRMQDQMQNMVARLPVGDDRMKQEILSGE
jgi:hypothetical protein